jgi:hypothetical protein
MISLLFLCHRSNLVVRAAFNVIVAPPQSAERLQSQTKIRNRPCHLCRHIPCRRTPAYHRPRPGGIVVAVMKVAVVPSSPLVIVVIAITADASFGNRNEAAPMGGVMADVKGEVWMQRRRLGAVGEGGGGRRRQRLGERRGDYGPVQSPSMVLVPT